MKSLYSLKQVPRVRILIRTNEPMHSSRNAKENLLVAYTRFGNMRT